MGGAIKEIRTEGVLLDLPMRPVPGGPGGTAGSRLGAALPFRIGSMRAGRWEVLLRVCCVFVTVLCVYLFVVDALGGGS